MQLEAMKEDLLGRIHKHLEGKLSLKEEIVLSEQLANPRNTAVEQILSDEWKYQLDSESIPNRNLMSVLDQIHHRIHLNEANMVVQTFWRHTFQRVAAILIFPLLLSFLAYFFFQARPSPEPVSYVEIECPMGSRIKFKLPDGSTGHLNSGSKLKYPVQFTKERTVELSGEAYFEVVHNKEIPFHVNTKNLDIKVLGTTFNVVANEDEQTEEIVLQTGKVDVSYKSGNQLATLMPNEQLTLDIEKQKITKKEVEASQYTAWKEGKLVFRNENMQQVALRLSRWYNAEVLVDDNLLDKYTFHATFIDEQLDEVLKLLSITTPLSFSEEKRASNKEGVYLKRKIILKINQSKINQFK